PLSVGNLQLAEGSLKIQPNPAHDVAQITVTRELLGANLKVMDMEGRSLLEKVVNAPTFKLETDKLSAGIYLLQVNTTYGKITRRLVIAR
ncbi:MAG TPA: T9SS type A sorting domain-containing protein, partial [Chitinophagales bacterium]|nr:T9SS type A sorting domain-containing protein [Chitinophagales bacterium]